MIKKCLITLLIYVFICNSLTAQKILPNDIIEHTLPNGLNVVTIPFDSPGIASFYILVRVGSREEVEPGKTGFAHFFEHMMFRGTDKYPKELYAETLKSTGASANANTSLDRTLYHMTGSADHLEKMFELESDRFRNLKYSVQDFKTEAGAVKGEYTKNYANPYAQLYEKTNNTAFDKHTYKHTTMGFFEDIVAMPDQFEYSTSFFDRFYKPEYCTIVVVGDVKHEQVLKLSEKYFGEWEKGNYVAEIPIEPEQEETRYCHIQVSEFLPYLNLNFKGPGFDLNENYFQALALLSQIMCSERSDLYKKLVIEEQKVRNLSGGIYPTRDPYLFSISASLKDNKDMAYVKKEIFSTIEMFKNELVNEKLLQEAKERIRYSFALSMDSPDAVANAVCNYIWLTGNADAVNKSYDIFEMVTPADIQAAAKKFLNENQLTIATISPDEKPILN